MTTSTASIAFLVYGGGTLTMDGVNVAPLGSSYIAAELRESIEYANEVTQRLGLSIQFIRSE